MANRKVSNFESLTLQLPARVKYTLMVNLSCNYMLLFITVELSYALQAQIVAFGCSACKNYFFLLRSNQIGYVKSGLFYRLLSFPAKSMRFRVRISEIIG